MTVAGKINLFTLLVAIAAGALLVAHTAVSTVGPTEERLFTKVEQRLRHDTSLQVTLHFRDPARLATALNDVLSIDPAVRYAVLLGPDGASLAQAQAPDSPLYEVLPFAQLRGRAGEADTTRNARPSPVTDASAAGLHLPGRDLIWDLTVPVLSLVSPLDRDIDLSGFMATLAGGDAPASLFVAGYVNVGISRNGLLASITPAIRHALLLALALIAAVAVVSRVLTRRITAPFATIVRMADDIAAGRNVQTAGLERNSEFKELVGLLNSIIGGLTDYKNRMDVGHQLLSMKVEERTSQLTRRNEELNRAVQEITATKDQLRQLAYYDSLTTLPNRRLFTEQLDLLLRLARRNQQQVALLFLDLDNFKRINDSLGHSAGDLLLREIGKRLARSVRESDLVSHHSDPGASIDVSRLGGDEFTVVLNQQESPESAAVVAERLLAELTRPMIIEGHELVVTPSIGIALAPHDADSVEGLLKAADTAMYQAKAQGKNRFVFYSPEMDAAGVERLTLENDLRKAIERGELELHYQPKVDIRSGSVVGAEALMRWRHPEHGMVPPFKFIPLAEEMGLIGELGEWGLKEACRQMVELQAAGLDLPKVSVNVSALQFGPVFVRLVSEALRESGVRPARLELELTEGIMLDSSQVTLESLAELKRLGVRLSVDDFGTGYSSLSYLSRFPLDELKIDRSFVVKLEQSEADASLVIAIIAMARSLGLQLVAEGVENHEQFRFLRRHGASVIQGYLFSKPVPLTDLKGLLKPGHFREQVSQIDRDAPPAQPQRAS